MRDPERIDRILAKLGDRWKEAPDLRLMQLLSNLHQKEDSFYLEDDILEALLEPCQAPQGFT